MYYYYYTIAIVPLLFLYTITAQHPYGFEEIDSDGEEDPYARDVLIIRNMMYSAPTVTIAITVSFPDGKVRAVVPETFQPDSLCKCVIGAEETQIHHYKYFLFHESH